MSYDAVIFDKDGVLVDSTEHGFEWEHRLRAKILSREGRDLDFEESRDVIEANTVEEMEEILKKKEASWKLLHEAEQTIAERKVEKLRKEHIELYPHVRDVLQAIELPKAVVSNAPRKPTEFVIDYYSLEQYFEAVFALPSDDMKKSVRMAKPSPEMLVKAMKALEAENPLMVGDSRFDIRAAERAGFDSCLVNPYSNSEKLDPDYRFDSIEGLRRIPGLT
ncbi:MAG: HAD family hydrolase [Candidatus Nanohaloarchaea archaeon]